MQRSIRNIVAGSALAVALVGGGAVAFAASSPATPNTPQSRIQAFLDDVASHLGVQPSALKSAIQAAEVDQVNQAVSAGKLTQAQAQKIEARINSGKVGMFGRFGRHGRRGFVPLKAAATYLGVTPAQLRTDLRNGQSLAQVATAQGKTVQGLEQAMLAPIKTRLDSAVSNGKLTAAREQAILQKVQARIAKMVNRVRTQSGSQTPPPANAPQP